MTAWLLAAAIAAADEPVAPSAPAPAFEIVTSLRAPVLALEDVRIHAARRTTAGLMIAGGVEISLGLVQFLAAEDEFGRTAGGIAGAGGVGHVAQGYFQRTLAERRHATFLADLAEIEGRPEALPSFVRGQRLAIEREARGQAFASGAHLGLLAAGIGAFALGDPQMRQPAATLAIVGVTGLVHHVLRWRASTRLSVDLDTAMIGVPTRLPDAD